MTTPTIAVIGAGHLGQNIITGLLKAQHPADKIWATSPQAEQLALLKKLDLHTTTNNAEAAQQAQIIILSVKPKVIARVVTELKSVLETQQPLLISVAAGIRIATIEKLLTTHLRIVRAMPNIPAAVQNSATALYANDQLSAVDRNLAESTMRSIGLTVWLKEEKLLDTVTALSGCGPAYFFLIMQCLEEAAVKLGLPEDIANLLTVQTALGAAHLAIESKKSFAGLRREVTSPGGSTEQAIAILEKHNIHGIFTEALTAAKKRAEEVADS